MRHKFFQTLVVGAAFLSVAALFAAQAGDALRLPAGFEHWYLVNSMLVTKDSPQFDTIGGLHHIYVNDVGLARLKKGGSTPYPDGTVFTDDVREFSLVDGSYTQGKRKAIPMMLKDSKKYGSTGGWGFQAWADGDPKKPLVTDPVKACFGCHTSQKANDFTFSTYLH
jgi:cytochrome P460